MYCLDLLFEEVDLEPADLRARLRTICFEPEWLGADNWIFGF